MVLISQNKLHLLNKLLPLLAFSILLLIPVGTQNAFAQQSGVSLSPENSQPDFYASNGADPMDIVYENGVPEGTGNSLFLHKNSVASDFVLENPTSITDVHFVLVERDDEIPTTFDGKIQYAILADNDGPDPNNVLGSGNAIKLETEDLGLGTFNDRPRILVWFDLESPVPLDAGVTYWLWLHAGDDFIDNQRLGWESTTLSPIGECSRFYSGEDFTGSPFITCGNEPWFQLTDKQDVVGGEFLPIDATTLILAGAQTNAIWIMSALVVIGSVAFGALYITSKKN